MGWLRRSPEGGIDVDKTLELLSKGGVLIDVRTLKEYVAGHAPGARLVDPKELAADPWPAVHGDDPLAEPEGTMIFICDTGLRSSLAARIAAEKGYASAFITDGLRGWVESGQYLLPGKPRHRR